MRRERAPITVSSPMVVSPPLSDMMALRVYIGLVPMSPYTTPRVTRIIPAERGIPALFDPLRALRPDSAALTLLISLLHSDALSRLAWEGTFWLPNEKSIVQM